MWQTKLFNTEEAMQQWIAEHKNNMQIQVIFVNNGFGVEYRILRKI